MRSVYVVVPSLEATGPIKGAVALCNGLAEHRRVTIVPLKRDVVGDGVYLDQRVKMMSLAAYRCWRDKYCAYRKVLDLAGGRPNVFSLSFCFSGDAFNFCMARHATIMSSVRGNLPRNYRIEYGRLGLAAAFLHLLLLHRFRKVITISSSMAEQLRRFGIFRLVTIGNFVDEKNLEFQRQPYKRPSGPFRFIFLGRLTPLKCPELAIQAVYALQEKGIACQLDIVGNGPMLPELEAQVRRLKLESSVLFHGYLSNPYQTLQAADCMVLPSRTEGISRAVIEALFFGVPAILRDVEASREVITPGANGELFTSDKNIAEVMARAVETPIRRTGSGTKNLLPVSFRQDANVERLLKQVLK